MPSISTLISSLIHLGPKQMALYGLYQFGLLTGHYRRSMPVGGKKDAQTYEMDLSAGPFTIPAASHLKSLLGEAGETALIAEAEEILDGKVRLFGGEAVPLSLTVPGPLEHWTVSEQGKSHWVGGQDIKYLWEPGRFGWVYPLGRAYALTGDERYPQAFWAYTRPFLEANPPNLGPHWASAQEVALRLVALIFAAQVFASSPSAGEWREALPRAVAEHARRIPPTLVYARAQNNNHLLTEALGLYAAGLVLPAHPESPRWRALGWKWLVHAFETQISPDGTYVQHSTNYHRLMLHVALLARALAARAGESLPGPVQERLAAAVHWLAERTDPVSGEMTNLGANDGANILPLTSTAFRDARPTLQAAARAFLGEPLFEAGEWDELGQWVGIGDQWSVISGQPDLSRGQAVSDPNPQIETVFQSAIINPQSSIAGFNLKSKISNPKSSSWSSLRAVLFTSRPSHADQLHVELWWRGINLARDAGTYLYNAPAPWDNALAATAVHNTVTVDGQDPMRRAGRFLWLDWAQASPDDPDAQIDGPLGEQAVAAVHDGYRKLGVIHRRCLTCLDERTWQVVDNLLPIKPGVSKELTARQHWLLPDWEWDIQGSTLRLLSPYGWIEVQVEGVSGLALVRAGETVSGAGPHEPILGWYSPTYGVKEPALSLIGQSIGRLPMRITTRWILM